MRVARFFPALILAALTLLLVPQENVSAQAGSSNSSIFLPILVAETTAEQTFDTSPFEIVEPDGTVVKVGIAPMSEEVLTRAVQEGIISPEEAASIRASQSELQSANWNTCSWLRDWSHARQRGSGWDDDGDYYKDYEQPEGTQYEYCVTPLYRWRKGQPSSKLVEPHYGANLFRRRMTIGMSGWPEWFVSQQAWLMIR